MRNNAASLRTVGMLICPGASMFEFAAAMQVFEEVNELPGDAGYRVFVCGPEERIRLASGIRLDVPHRLSRLRHVDTVVIAPHYGRLPEPVLSELRRAHARGARMVTLCTGVFALADAGLLAGRRVTTHWAEADALARYPGVEVDPSVLYVDGGDILTSAGSAASIDLCLHVVRTDFGTRIASATARNMVVPPHRDGGQAQYVDAPVQPEAGNDLFAATMDWARGHLDESLHLDDLARRAAMSPRTFARRFAATTGTTPYRWLLRCRLQLAQQLLEDTDLTVDVVAERSGLGSAANLRARVGRALHTSPQNYRATFRGPERGTVALSG